jgi:hypothetical protein
MSHVDTHHLDIKDLSLMPAVAEALGGTYEECSTYRWWGRHVGDHPLPEGMTADDMGKCVGKISFPDCEWDVGIVPSRTKPGEYDAIFDFYGGAGHRLQQKVGVQCEKIKQQYGLMAARAMFARRGIKCTETRLADGTLRLVAVGA